MRPHTVVILAALTLLAACGDEAKLSPKPQEPGPQAMGFFCRMTLAEHQGPKGQIVLKGWKDPIWFSSVRDALTYAQSEVVSEKEIAAFWVNDMGQGTWEKPAPGSWIEAKDAHYVIGSRKSSGMGGSESVPFRERSAAEAFAKDHGGSVGDYAAALNSIAEDPMSSGLSGGGT